jgi:hypothetical protein
MVRKERAATAAPVDVVETGVRQEEVDRPALPG